MFEEKYYLNRETLRYEKFEKPFTQKVRDGFLYFILLAVLAAGIRFVFDQHFDSPKIKYFTEMNENLRHEYLKLNKEITKAEFMLTEIQKRDDLLYRSVFELDPIPSSIREAGFGGSDNYENLLHSNSVPLVANTARKLEKLSTKARVQENSLDDLMELARKQQIFLAHKPSIQPISPSEKYWLTSTFGYRYDPFTKRKKYHHGLDLAGNIGLKIYATGDGVVKDIRYNLGGYGKEVLIDHGFGYVTRYAHLNKFHVKEGEEVKKGQLIAELGNTGRSTGPHLHYEVLYHSRPLNPMLFYNDDLSPREFNQIVSR